MNDYRIILIHGYNKDHRDMFPLGKYLEDEGFLVEYLNLPLTFTNLDVSINMLKKVLSDIRSSGVNQKDEIVLIGHSLGGIVIRGALADKRMRRIVDRVVLIASPNNGSKLVRRLDRVFPFFKYIFKPLKSLTKANFKNLRLYTGKEVEIATIAGSEPELFLGRFLDDMSDGRIDLKEALLKKTKDSLTIPLNHKEIHKREGTARYIINFIKTGNFVVD